MTHLLWSTDPATQRALIVVLAVAAGVVVTIYLPLALRTFRLRRLEGRLRQLVVETPEEVDPRAREELRNGLLQSPIEPIFRQFERRWETARLAEDGARAPVRLIDVLDEHPLLPFGPRRSLLPVLPGLFIALGVLAALAGLIPSLDSLTGAELAADARAAWAADRMGDALRVAGLGFLCGIAASLTGRLLEGAFAARSHGLDEVVEAAFGSISPGELAELTRRTQQTSLDTLGRELTHFAGELSQRLDRGLQRIEQSSARAANLVSQEQRGALHTVVQELSLSVRQGVEHHLAELRGALQRAVDHQSSVTGGLAETFQRMVENAQTQDRVAQSLSDSATAVEEAARAMRANSSEMQPVLDHLGSTSQALAATADRINDTQQVVSRTAEGVRSSLEHAASGVDDQRQFLELSLSEIRRAIVALGDGLGESLQRSLREVDGVLAGTVGQLRDTLAESNETIDRLSAPIRAAEGSTRETHLALDRVRGEVEALGSWLSQAAKPLRAGLGEVEGRAEEIARSLVEFSGHSRQMDKTMEALRLEIHEESRRLQAAGSDLGRRLQLASDAMGLLESTTSEVARRARPEGSSTLPPRERRWPPISSPRDLGRESIFSPTSFERTSPPAPSTSTPRPIAEEALPSPPDRTPAAPDFEPLDDEDLGATGPDLSGADLSGPDYRLGAARAQGPDPYARFDEDSTTESNVRSFPIPDSAPPLELGDDLKLSGLLGPSGRSARSTRGSGRAENGSAGPHEGEAHETPEGEEEQD